MAAKYTIKRMQQEAQIKMGKCLSELYRGSTHKLEWKCKFGHKWLAEPRCIVSGQWCPKCAHDSRKLSINYMQQLANEKLGKCLSKNYRSCKIKLRWQCQCGFIWRSTPQNIISGTWCPKCAGKEHVQYKRGYKKNKYTTKDIELISQKYGFILLTDDAKHISKKYLFKCENGHKIKLKPSVIKYRAKNCCYKCNRRIKEEQCRFILEEITDIEFNPSRKILNGLELDGYNYETKIAFEYHGEQHYRFIKYWHKSIKGLQKQQLRDRRLRSLCQNKGIKLIEIPYFYSYSRKQLLEYIVSVSKSLDIPIVKSTVDWKHFKGKPVELHNVQKSCQEKNITCLSGVYINARTKMKFRCNVCKREWKTIPDIIVNRKYGCKHCSLIASWKKRKQKPNVREDL